MLVRTNEGLQVIADIQVEQMKTVHGTSVRFDSARISYAILHLPQGMVAVLLEGRLLMQILLKFRNAYNNF